MKHFFSILKRETARLRGEDAGASALLIALSLVVLLTFAAVALDAAGMGFNERRQNQSAADVGALAAVQFASPTAAGHPECSALSGISLSRCNGAVEARDVANATLDDASLAIWTDASRCATPPAGYTTVPAVSACIAFNVNNQRAWVRIPTIDNPTSIGKAVGFNTVATTAEAIAGTSFDPPGGVLPFLLPGLGASSDYNCLKAGANPNFGPCEDLPTSGNFGSADFFLYGNLEKGWTQRCSGDENGRLVANIARGTDHPLSKYDPVIDNEVEESSNCPDIGAQPNTVNSQTGIGSNLEQGLLYGGSAYASSPYPGALQASGAGSYTVRSAGGPKAAAIVDDIPLWDYLKTGIPGSDCSGVDTPPEMGICIAWAKDNDEEIFTDDLASSPRFGWVPELWELDFTGNPYHIKDYRPVFLDTTWYGCTAGPDGCDIMHTPGLDDSGACIADPPDTRITCGTIPAGAWNRNLEAVTAWVLEADIVPPNAKTPPPGSANQRTFNLID
ncbi:MAG TPA: pilus assembly protein TadG-related protein [Acidimicrobiia bacterium]|nr:pilus assembly protein TadG-related protein [Acidimicrobiia bacterium]